MSINPTTVESYWMPFTANRDYKKKPRVFVGAEGHHYLTADGRRVSTRRSTSSCAASRRRSAAAWAINSFTRHAPGSVTTILSGRSDSIAASN